MICHDLPTCPGMENVLKRAAFLREFRWTPVAKMPMTTRYNSKQTPTAPIAYYQVWRPQHGIPYSSVAVAEKFVGFNVSPETYVSALANPKSVLYTRNLIGTRARTTCWYGSVCSVYVAYAFGLPCRRVARQWGSYGDMDAIGAVKAAQDLKLCDILCNDHHVALVTDITRDENGTVQTVTVSECTPPQIIGVEYTPEELYHSWLKKYEVFRYRHFERVTYTPTVLPPVNRTLLPDYGNRANYALGEPVELNVMEEGWDSLCIECSGSQIRETKPAAFGVVTWMPEKVGVYRAYCRKGETVSEAVEFAVTDLTLAITAKGDTAEVEFHCGDPVVCCMFSLRPTFETVYYHELTPQEAAGKKIVLTGLIPGTYDVKAIAANAFGQYRSRMETVTVEG